MMHQRRDFLRDMGQGGLVVALLSSGLITMPKAWAAQSDRAAFGAKSVEEAFAALGVGTPEMSDQIDLQAPEIAENGAVVPVSVTSAIAGTEAIAILVEKNPNALAAVATIPAGTEPYVSTRVKMQQTSNVIALVRSGGKFFMASKDVKVTLGGCGG